MGVGYVNKDVDGNYTLVNRPEVKLSENEFNKLQELMAESGQVTHWVIFCDYSGKQSKEIAIGD